jgi:hypothetical protein
MIDDPFGIPEYHMRQARLRLTLKPDGTAKGVMGGYQDWDPIYVSFAVPGATNEVNLSIDIPGIYYALKRLADAYPDPATGQNTAISAAYAVEAIPAFIVHPDDVKFNKTAQADIAGTPPGPR